MKKGFGRTMGALLFSGLLLYGSLWVVSTAAGADQVNIAEVVTESACAAPGSVCRQVLPTP